MRSLTGNFSNTEGTAQHNITTNSNMQKPQTQLAITDQRRESDIISKSKMTNDPGLSHNIHDVFNETPNQKDMVLQFCKEYALENGFAIRDTERENQQQNDYEDVTGQKQYLSKEEVTEMESVIYSISFGKQSVLNKITYQAFSAAISQQMHVDMVMSFIQRR